MKVMFKYLDTAKIDKITERQDGSIIVPARLTRIGVFEYPEGPQLRPEEEIFKDESLASLNDIPLTIEHPYESEVTPENFKKEVVGHIVNGSVKREGDYIIADLIVSDKEAIDLVKNKKMLELSCGYMADDDQTPGMYENQEYSSIQRNVVYNHISLVDQGRAGPECRMIVDAKTQIKKVKNMIKIDGKEFEEGSKEHIEMLQVKLDASEKALKEVSSPKFLAKKVAERVKLIDAIRKIVKDADEEVIADMDDRQAMEAALAEKFPDMAEKLKEKSDDFIAGFFDAVAMSAKSDEVEIEVESPEASVAEEEVMDEQASLGSAEEVEVVDPEKKTDSVSNVRSFRKVTKDAAKKFEMIEDKSLSALEKYKKSLADRINDKSASGIHKSK